MTLTRQLFAKLTLFVMGLLTVLSLGVSTVKAQELFPECQPGGRSVGTEFCAAAVGSQDTDTERLFGPDSLLNNITQTIIFIAAGVSVLMIVIGGLRYVLSNGDPQGISAAKNTIIYAVVGVIISLLAEAILRLVLQRL